MKPTFWHRVWFRIATFFTYWYLKTQLYRFWSWIHQRIFDSVWDKVDVKTYQTIGELRDWLNGFQWFKDSIWELFDAVCTPNKVQAIGNLKDNTVTYKIFRLFTVKLKHGNDCDEIGRYISYAVTKSIGCGTLKSDIGITKAFFFTTTWMEATGKVNGHNVGLFLYTDGLYSYMDYDMPSVKLKTIKKVAELISSTYSSRYPVTNEKVRATPMVWCASNPASLRPEMIAHN